MRILLTDNNFAELVKGHSIRVDATHSARVRPGELIEVEIMLSDIGFTAMRRHLRSAKEQAGFGPGIATVTARSKSDETPRGHKGK